MYFPDIYRVDPFEEINHIQHEMNRLFNGALGTKNRGAYPALNIWSNQEAAYVIAELPGYDAKDFNLSVVGDLLMINGERKAPEVAENQKLQRQERVSGRFERNVRLPFPIEGNKIDATYTNGVLHIMLPRAEETKPRKIEIKSH